MKTQGIDRVVIGVRDMDKAMAFFADMFEAEFIELKGPSIEAMEERAAISFETQIELLSPLVPLTEKAHPFIKRLAEQLETRESILAGLSYRVKETKATEAEAARKGIRIDGVIETDELDEQLRWRNFRELIANEEDTFGVFMAFVQYDRS